MIGIKDLKEAAVLGAKFANPLFDGFQLGDFGPIGMALLDLPKVIDGYENIPEQLADLDDQERVDIEAAILNELTNLPEESDVTKITPTLIKWGLVSGELISEITALKKS